jgi:hypothetical protein
VGIDVKRAQKGHRSMSFCTLYGFRPSQISHLGSMAGTTGLEPATSAVTGQRSDQLSYVPRLFFNNLVIRHIESSASQLSPFSLFSTISLPWTQFWASVDTTWTPKWTPKSANQQRNLVYQMKQSFSVHLPGHSRNFCHKSVIRSVSQS